MPLQKINGMLHFVEEGASQTTPPTGEGPLRKIDGVLHCVEDTSEPAPTPEGLEARPSPPSLEEVLAAGYQPGPAHGIVAREAAKHEGASDEEAEAAADAAKAAWVAENRPEKPGLLAKAKAMFGGEKEEEGSSEQAEEQPAEPQAEAQPAEGDNPSDPPQEPAQEEAAAEEPKPSSKKKKRDSKKAK